MIARRCRTSGSCTRTPRSTVSLIAGHQLEQPAQLPAAGLQQLAGAHQIACVGLLLGRIEGPPAGQGRLAIEVAAVVVGLHLAEHRLEGLPLRLQVGLGGLGDFGAVEAWRQQGLPQVRGNGLRGSDGRSGGG